ncbi:MAG: hypothetical protein EZS28_045491 [Streblomastix strix]|uniref:DDE-1 domain-containing protein n=1 Tax=Streblomastix strix TaxID=222440 RepID=A0A5J4TM86_9EUKA|nr:MAG: hypothetical protein EZS28_045491 [Streblomastix strix]
MEHIGCYRNNEKFILFVDRYSSRGDEDAQQLLSQAGVTMITYLGELTLIQQPIDKWIGKLFREAFRIALRLQRDKFKSKSNLKMKFVRDDKKGVINDSANPKYPNGRQTTPITSKIINAIETPNKEQNNSKSDTNSTIMEFDSDEYIDESCNEKK